MSSYFDSMASNNVYEWRHSMSEATNKKTNIICVCVSMFFVCLNIASIYVAYDSMYLQAERQLNGA